MKCPISICCLGLFGTLLSASASMAQEPAAPAPVPAAQPMTEPAPAPSPLPPPPAYYPPVAMVPMQAPGYHTHDGGFIRFLVGPGYMHNSASYKGTSLAISGWGATFEFAAGGAVAPDLVIFGELVGTTVSGPTLKQGSQSAKADSDISATLVGLGGGATYFFSDNFYGSASILMSRLVMKNSKTDDSGGTDMGVGGHLVLGKEWWVSDNWGLGLAANFMVASMKAKDYDARWTGLSTSIMFSATYN